MSGDMACYHHQILDDRAYPASFYRGLHGMVRTDTLVTDHTQNVIGSHRKFQANICHHRAYPPHPLQVRETPSFLVFELSQGVTSMSTGTKLQGIFDGETWFFTSRFAFSHKRLLRMELLRYVIIYDIYNEYDTISGRLLL